mmetsp:Transcript_59567/g.141742  ORF Transcript_59567/g.141742 Transcript_59567/m.141742 type:complete len:295 (+) Transcript_59567:71-955(+)
MGRYALECSNASAAGFRHTLTSFADDSSDQMASNFSPLVVGKTSNKEECRCKTGEVIPGPRETSSGSWLSGLRWMSDRRRRLFFEVEGNKMKQEQDQLVDHFKEALVSHDKEFRKLQTAASEVERDAQDMVDRYHDVRDAYEDGECQKVAQVAREDGAVVPWCESTMNQAKSLFESHIEKPQGKYGATTLRALVDRDAAHQLMHKYKVAVGEGSKDPSHEGEEDAEAEPQQDSVPFSLVLLAAVSRCGGMQAFPLRPAVHCRWRGSQAARTAADVKRRWVYGSDVQCLTAHTFL